jgi:hypothetical protein
MLLSLHGARIPRLHHAVRADKKSGPGNPDGPSQCGVVDHCQVRWTVKTNAARLGRTIHALSRGVAKQIGGRFIASGAGEMPLIKKAEQGFPDLHSNSVANWSLRMMTRSAVPRLTQCWQSSSLFRIDRSAPR